MTEQTFIAAILADPADDGPRLAYADWLMERGDPRGEFIAVQCRIAGLECAQAWLRLQGRQHNNGPCRCGRCVLQRRERELFRFDMAGELPPGWPITLTTGNAPSTSRRVSSMAYVRRGFIAEVHCTIADWMQHGPALVRACPIEVFRPVGVEPRFPSIGWYEDDIGTKLFDACVSLGVKEGYFVSDPWERISRAAVKWARGVDGVNVGQLSTKENER